MNPKDAIGRTKTPLHLIPVGALAPIAQVMKTGADKYGAYNWRTEAVSATVYYDAAMRHMTAFLDGEDNDPESGESHLAHAAACQMILLDGMLNNSWKDDRPWHGVTAKPSERPSPGGPDRER